MKKAGRAEEAKRRVLEAFPKAYAKQEKTGRAKLTWLILDPGREPLRYLSGGFKYMTEAGAWISAARRIPEEQAWRASRDAERKARR